MESLHPVAQVTAIIIIGAVVSILFLAALTDFFDKNRNS
jgi:hypothetical protein